MCYRFWDLQNERWQVEERTEIGDGTSSWKM